MSGAGRHLGDQAPSARSPKMSYPDERIETVSESEDVEPRAFTEEEIAALNESVDGLGLAEAEKRLLAGHDEPDAGCILDGIGRLFILAINPERLPLALGAALARSAPGTVRDLVSYAVNQTAEGLIEELAAGLSFPDDSEAGR